jgi:hypothetical protein
VTLTLDPRACSASESAKYIRDCWAKFRTYLKRHCGASVSFISVLEKHKSGYCHLHVLVDRYLSQEWIREAWMAVGGGKIVDIRFVDMHRVGAYLGKYLTKEVFLGIKKARRVTSSRDISLFVKREKEGEWELRPVPIEALYLMWEKLSEDVSLSRDGVLLSFEVAVR